jgi:hypothetical protein
MRDVCAMILYTAKKHGIADTVLGKVLSIIAIIANETRHQKDNAVKFPKSVRGLKSLLDLDENADQVVIYICPLKISTRRKGEAVLAEEVCGFTLRSIGDPPNEQYHCDLCASDWDRKTVRKDGNHFVSSPISWIVSTIMGKFGRYVSLPARTNADGIMTDITDGERYCDMKLGGSDLAILIHGDGAAISKST